ncbi:MAG: hypothetical protein CR991_10635 [Proteobacteria bacterium]|nr:MAG: hypothetical protein CR991_10635 [Pseudomonadota bacterium]
MIVSDDFKLTKVESNATSLAVSGNQSLTVEGLKIEAQYLLHSCGSLLILSDNQPFEERINVHLIDNNKLLDTLEISPPYQSIIIEDSQIIDDQTIGLTINNDQFLIHVRTTAIGLLEKLKLLTQGEKFGKNGLLTFQNPHSTPWNWRCAMWCMVVR